MKNGQAYQQKTEKIFVSEEKKFGRIDSRTLIKYCFSTRLKYRQIFDLSA